MSSCPQPSSNTDKLLRDVLRSQVEDDGLKLPLLPDVAQRVLAMAEDPDASVADLAKLISRDPSLCAHVLRAANSPWYRRGANIGSIRQALAQLGSVNLGQIAWTVAIGSAVLRGSTFKRELNTWWTTALASALAAKEIARSLHQSVDSAFLCGLMQEIGRPMLFGALSELGEELGQSREQLHAAANPLVDEFQRAAGLLLAHRWRLPAPVRAGILGLEDATSEEERHHAALAQLALRVAQHVLDPDTVDAEEIRRDPACSVLNIYPDAIETLIAKRLALLESLETMK
ncbi:MAG: HDOD domain-containing protein [Nannocystaceae bacterium]